MPATIVSTNGSVVTLAAIVIPAMRVAIRHIPPLIAAAWVLRTAIRNYNKEHAKDIAKTVIEELRKLDD